MNEDTATTSNSTYSHGSGGEVRQKALQEELRSLIDVVGPGPLVDLLLERSFELGATDIHFDPRIDGLHVRLRVDGILHDILHLNPNMTSQVISRLKLMAGMDITERRTAQDGHISNAVLKGQRDIRVGGGPTLHGERLVLRLMPNAQEYTSLDQLGLEPTQADTVRKYIHSPYGMMLSVGPVGSGKSTTMYSCLELLNDPGKSLVTIEDPVERRMAGVNQIQVDQKIDFHFAEALRGVLRQDPDVIMVGEIRDPETAHIAVRAGLTGIRVLSTLHANETAATIDVFRDFGIPPMFIADSVNCVISQRLLRKVCSNSNEDYHPDAAACQFLGIDPNEGESVSLKRGIPADCNFHTGYMGRTGVFEVLPVDSEIRDAIIQNKSSRELHKLAAEHGMMSLEKAAKKKVLAGETTIEELHRVLVFAA
ncbi:GspE/PulE family protein [Rubinisphaera sp.]|uniref:GspE/PulE family protein n=1 Tax=Rubinisphaera sp. TaxID=2024857 RepID=UPI000C0FCAE7|nr:GspE/PulE family protein [Rubinisphaera sp.]MBV07688.1 general secretion pathway protein GspE [Rubinisphaera sp.]HCS51998.1 type II/IV secretion system protein [Planctomycetaceae bacterium]